MLRDKQENQKYLHQLNVTELPSKRTLFGALRCTSDAVSATSRD